LDGTGGKTFLRVLLHLGMHDYPPLVSGALKLLFRHFAQRQEVLQAFKQVRIAATFCTNFRECNLKADTYNIIEIKTNVDIFIGRLTKKKKHKSLCC
jgi:hypothetical protein